MIIIINSSLTVVLPVCAMWLHGFSFFYIELFASSTYRCSFTVDKSKWNVFYICEFVSSQIEMLWYCVVGVMLNGS